MSSVGTAFAAHLRVYEPLAAFDGDERRAWEAYLGRGEAPEREHGLRLEHEAALRALTGREPAGLPDLSEHAFVTEVDGVVLLCPWRTRVRAVEALMEFTDDLPEELAEAYLPRATAEAAIEELEDWRLTHPKARVHVTTSAWEVPTRWFLLVEPHERELSTGTGSTGSGRSGGAGMGSTGAPPGQRTLVYRTPMSRARRRVARALAVLRATFADGGVTDGGVTGSGVVDGVEDLARWLEEFHPRSLVELDYGGLVHLASDEALAGDESAADVAAAVAALASGSFEEAGTAYARVRARMKALQAVEGAN